MNNLFSVFDPNTPWLNLSVNWVSMLFVVMWMPAVYWASGSQYPLLLKKLLTDLASEFKNNLSPVNTPGHTHWALSIFFLILLNNVGGMTPYTFTGTSHLSVTTTLALSAWVSYWGASLTLSLGQTLAHLVPIGTPYILMPLMVLIELVSSLIRPLTLAVRLAANMVAGHLLMTLTSTPLVHMNFLGAFLIFMGLVMLIVLESAVAIIQAYVFSMLSTLYLGEANGLNLNYLCNLLPLFAPP